MSILAHTLPARYQDQIAAQLDAANRAAYPQLTTAKPRLRQDRTGLNKTEAAFLAHLHTLYSGKGVHITAQGMTLKLANGVRYTPDFIVALSPVVQEIAQVLAFETKGWMREDAAIKAKMAAQQWPWIALYIATKRKGGGWDIERVCA